MEAGATENLLEYMYFHFYSDTTFEVFHPTSTFLKDIHFMSQSLECLYMGNLQHLIILDLSCHLITKVVLQFGAMERLCTCSGKNKKMTRKQIFQELTFD